MVLLFFGNFNVVANLHLKGRDGDLMTVQRKDAVAGPTDGPESGVGEAEAVHDVVQTAFEESEQIRAGHALRHIGVDEVTVELLFQNAINATHLLLFTQLDGVVAQFFTGAAMLTGRVGAAVKGALVGEATVALPTRASCLHDGTNDIWHHYIWPRRCPPVSATRRDAVSAGGSRCGEWG